MPKFRVYVSGTLDWDYEIEADDKYDAGAEAEVMFGNEFNVGWSSIDWQEAEEIEDDES